MKITADGIYDITNSRAWESVVYLGTTGGATVTLEKNGVPITDGLLAENTQTIVRHGKGARIQANIAGFSADFDIAVHGVYNA